MHLCLSTCVSHHTPTDGEARIFPNSNAATGNRARMGLVASLRGTLIQDTLPTDHFVLNKCSHLAICPMKPTGVTLRSAALNLKAQQREGIQAALTRYANDLRACLRGDLNP